MIKNNNIFIMCLMTCMALFLRGEEPAQENSCNEGLGQKALFAQMKEACEHDNFLQTNFMCATSDERPFIVGPMRMSDKKKLLENQHPLLNNGLESYLDELSQGGRRGVFTGQASGQDYFLLYEIFEGIYFDAVAKAALEIADAQTFEAKVRLFLDCIKEKHQRSQSFLGMFFVYLDKSLREEAPIVYLPQAEQDYLLIVPNAYIDQAKNVISAQGFAYEIILPHTMGDFDGHCLFIVKNLPSTVPLNDKIVTLKINEEYCKERGISFK